MSTTIQIEKEVRDELSTMKIHSRETYNDVLERILEDLQELNQETKKEIEKALKEIKSGKSKKHEDLKKEMGF
jgi:ABC-type Zn uptake system ZnuABC Zn-binding protein ZnuA